MICQDFRLYYYIHAFELVRELPHEYFRLSASSSAWLDSTQHIYIGWLQSAVYSIIISQLPGVWPTSIELTGLIQYWEAWRTYFFSPRAVFYPTFCTFGIWTWKLYIFIIHSDIKSLKNSLIFYLLFTFKFQSLESGVGRVEKLGCWEFPVLIFRMFYSNYTTQYNSSHHDLLVKEIIMRIYI